MKTKPLKEKRFFQIYETSEPVLVTKVNPKDVKEGKDYILVTKEGYILKTAPFGDISYYEIYEVEKNSDYSEFYFFPSSLIDSSVFTSS